MEPVDGPSSHVCWWGLVSSPPSCVPPPLFWLIIHGACYSGHRRGPVPLCSSRFLPPFLRLRNHGACCHGWPIDGTQNRRYSTVSSWGKKQWMRELRLGLQLDAQGNWNVYKFRRNFITIDADGIIKIKTSKKRRWWHTNLKSGEQCAPLVN
jgi:hypothetical protein